MSGLSRVGNGRSRDWVHDERTKSGTRCHSWLSAATPVSDVASSPVLSSSCLAIFSYFYPHPHTPPLSPSQLAFEILRRPVHPGSSPSSRPGLIYHIKTLTSPITIFITKLYTYNAAPLPTLPASCLLIVCIAVFFVLVDDIRALDSFVTPVQ